MVVILAEGFIQVLCVVLPISQALTIPIGCKDLIKHRWLLPYHPLTIPPAAFQ